ncbi:MAG: TetR/AcrR family transcriptional regulator [Burkholderiaceae bacterium]
MARQRSAGYDDQREKILKQATHLFASRGYPATSMNEVADACGYSKATLYHYYDDKYDLLVNIAESHISRLEALVAEVQEQGLAPERFLRELIRRMLVEYADAQDAQRVLTAEARFLNPRDADRVLAKERSVVGTFARALVALRPELQKESLAKPLTMLLFGMINWLFTWMRPGGALDHEGMADVVSDLFLGGLPAVRLPELVGSGRSSL